MASRVRRGIRLMKAKAEDRRGKAHPAIEIIKSRIQERLTAAGLSGRDASDRADLGITYANDILSGRSLRPTRESLAKLGAILNTDVEYFFGEQDEPRIGASATKNAAGTRTAQPSPASTSIPLFHIGLTDPDGFFALNAGRRSAWTPPLFADKDTYGITVPDDTMAPRYRIGEVVIVSPSTPVVHGGFAIVRQADDRVTIREVVTISPDKISVRCMSSETIIEIPRSQVKSLERIVGSCELT